MSRYIVVNPDLGRIQGDIACETPARAVQVLESRLTLDTDNEAWDVYRAPEAFPDARAPYAADDAALLGLLASAGRPARFGNARRSAPLSLTA